MYSSSRFDQDLIRNFTVPVSCGQAHAREELADDVARITFLSFDEPESKFALNDAAFRAGVILNLLNTKAIMEVAPSTAPVSSIVPGCAISYSKFPERGREDYCWCSLAPLARN